jgi:hypothetical protein
VSFTGTVYFDFESADSWRLFVLLASAEQQGMSFDLDWVGFAPGGPGTAEAMSPGVRALAAHAAVIEPQRQQRLRAALFTLRHREGDSLDDELTYRAAARVAGVDGDVLLEAIPDVGHRSLVVAQRKAADAGVEAVPSIARHGPPVHIVTTPAVHQGPAKPRLAVIDEMLSDDGLWRLSKP